MPNVIIKDGQNKECFLIDTTVPSEICTSTKEVENLLKYKDFEIEIIKMWGMKTSIVPIVVGTLGLIKKEIHKT